MGSDNRSAQYTSGSGNAQQVFGYTIDDLLTSGENDSNGLSTGSDPIVLPSGSTIKDLAGNSAILTHAGMSTNSAYKVDTIPPTVDSTAITGENGIQNYFLNPGDYVEMTANFSETVLKVSGSPTLTIVVGSDNRSAAYNRGHNSENLVFRYTIDNLLTSGENDSDGISIPTNALSLNNGIITDLADNIASESNVSHASAPDNASFMVDTIPPDLNSFTMDDIDVKIGDTPEVTLVFSEEICPYIIGFSGCAETF